MKYLVKIALTPEAGHAIETRPGGPGPVIQRIVERFKPEALYMATTERTMFLVTDLAAPADVAELMIAGTELAGQHPTFTPVLPGKDFGTVVGNALPAATKLING